MKNMREISTENYGAKSKKPRYEYVFNKNHTVINPEDILYAYSDNRVCCLVMKNGEEHRFYKKLDQLENELEEIYLVFVRTSKSYLVNRNYIKSFNRKHVRTRGRDILPVSRSRYEQMRAKLLMQ